MSFQVGDMVVCVDAVGTPQLTEGYHYTIARVLGFGICDRAPGRVLGVLVFEAHPSPGHDGIAAFRFRKVGTAHDERETLAKLKQPVAP